MAARQRSAATLITTLQLSQAALLLSMLIIVAKNAFFSQLQHEPRAYLIEIALEVVCNDFFDQQPPARSLLGRSLFCAVCF